uniref:Uncharacterized protein n=1 Tax=Zooxanthella nutricula TaxID=1333877 RepID=A0A7S2HS28_9DINO
MTLYASAQDAWQSVCLVTRARSDVEAEEAVVINRPLSRRMDEKLAHLLLNGADFRSPRYSDEVVDRLRDAFGRDCAVYFGGPELQTQPGLFVHGFGSLPGAREVAAGTGIYVDGVEAAIDGVLEGRFSPLDFRWFVGRSRGLDTSSGEWCAVACSRPVALKQCLGLPKPLWHEVMELCGGEAAELSRLELIKRNDLAEQQDGDDEP